MSDIPTYAFTVTLQRKDNQTPTESLNWLQRWFDYFHPSMHAKVQPKPVAFPVIDPGDILQCLAHGDVDLETKPFSPVATAEGIIGQAEE